MYFLHIEFPSQNTTCHPLFTSKEAAHDFRIAMNRCLPRCGKGFPFLVANEVYEIDVEDNYYDSCEKI